MKGIISTVAICFATSLSAQISFEKGYLITNDGKKQEVLIKHLDKLNNPKDITIKTDENSNETIYTPNNIKEYGIYNYGKFISYNGPLDQSSNKISELSSQYAPDLKESSIFLKEEVAGVKNLYSYTANNTVKCFYSGSDETLYPLVYKQYFFGGDVNKVATNNTYLKQLEELFAGDEKTQKLVSRTKYTINDLKKIFITYNQSQGTTIGNDTQDSLSKKENSSKFNLNIRPGINFFAPLKLENTTFSNTEFDAKSSFRIGLEAELILPFNRNKWSVLLEPSYSLYSSEKQVNKSNEIYDFSMDTYSFINVFVGIRHHMYITDKSKIIANVGVNAGTFKFGKAQSYDLAYNGETFYTYPLTSSQSFQSFVIGIGYVYNNKFMFEARYNSKYNILDNKNISKVISSNMSYFSLILGYNIF
ncbi:hypothetical protein [uncultured Chryseobacterium sp.]|jgi:hypothetical protein|uniref:hypothetical protein n=1 Tax=uncultured Chryseobacterium sp. TaxID=259322 RepID=UPI00262169E7|nr:hypothetical protein [uncultured Chryseobacterium sp.]